jgi:hypothetical protein
VLSVEPVEAAVPMAHFVQGGVEGVAIEFQVALVVSDVERAELGEQGRD